MPSLFCETDQETIKVTCVDYRAKKSEKCRGGTNEKMDLYEFKRKQEIKCELEC